MFGRWLSWCSYSGLVCFFNVGTCWIFSSLLPTEYYQKYGVGMPLGGGPARTPAPRERGAKGNDLWLIKTQFQYPIP
jgi:hypothetical protein